MIENLLTAWATLLIDSLAAAGVTDVIVSPGSRSTPFVLAATAHPRLRVRDAIDERAAAFYALGQARVSGRPSLLLCTSGTAGAHYLPAVIEASLSSIPLLVLTADRPPELHDCGANQTIDQRGLFGSYTRHFVDLGAPDAAPTALRGLRRAAVQAVALARTGPVHVNAPARKPLEPRNASTPDGLALDAQVAALLATPATRVAPTHATPDLIAIDELARLCLRARRGVIVAGPAPAAQGAARAAVTALASVTGFPVLAEAASQLRFTGHARPGARVDGFDWLWRMPRFRAEQAPDLVLQLGAPPTSGGWERLLDEHPPAVRALITPAGWPDPHGTATHVIHADLAPALEALVAALVRVRGTSQPEPNPYAASLAAADALVWRLVDAELGASAAALTEGAACRLTTAALASGDVFVVGNSLPIRTVDGFAPGPLADVRVLSQRGASGIDGLVAGAAGAASAGDRPVTLLVGDVSFLHDVGGLMLARHARVPLVLVVINNDGGRIFEQLPVGAGAAPRALEHFVTPHGLSLEPAARLYGHAYARATTRGALAAALAEAHARTGCTVIEAIVPPHSAAEQQARIAAALDTALGAR